MTAIEKKYTITINCCMCDNKTEHSIDLPEGWDHKIGGIDDEDAGFCPGHAAIKPFTDDQCPGCVGGWGDCGLWRAFAYERSRTINERHLSEIEKGRCPFRVNGSFCLDVRNESIIKDDDLSERATTESGKALADGIRGYIERWPSHPPAARSEGEEM